MRGESIKGTYSKNAAAVIIQSKLPRAGRDPRMILYCVLGFISRPRRWAAGTVQTQSTVGIEIDFYYFCAGKLRGRVVRGVGMIKSLLEEDTKRVVIRFETLFW